MPKGLCWSSPVGAAKGSRNHPSLPLQALLALRNHMAHVSLDLLQSVLLFWVPLAAFQVSQQMGQSNTPK